MIQRSSDDDKRLLQLIKLTNFLSFGPETTPVDLKSLNIIIGINGVGKSNLIEAVALMRATPMDIGAVVRKGGGVSEWIWKGERNSPATIEVVVSNPKGTQSLVHLLSFYSENGRFQINDEKVENEYGYDKQRPYFYYHFEGGHPVVNIKGGKSRQLSIETIDPTLSILSQRRDPEHYPEISYLADAYGSIRIYREWSFGRNTVFREPQKADMRNDRLEEDFSNLGLFLNRISRQHPKAKKEILEGLSELYENLSDFNVSIEGGTVQVFLTENEFTIPATRLSDGTLRYLCLLAILCDPEPPSLICIEEPELGLHPDILPKLADYLVAASKRTQLIVTTHSDILINAMTERPEVVLVCEKHNGCTSVRRLKEEDLKVWLEKYRLGELWIQGHLGGTRW
ncbi:MAG: AAA family ATPase [Candidatus Methanoperedens sp.]